MKTFFVVLICAVERSQISYEWVCYGLELGSNAPDGELQPMQASSTRLWWQEGWNSVKQIYVLCFSLRVGET